MTNHLDQLIEQARSGDTERVQQLQRALKSADVPAATLVSLLRSETAALRKVAIAAARDRDEPELLRAVAELARDPERDVRVCLATMLRQWPESPARPGTGETPLR